MTREPDRPTEVAAPNAGFPIVGIGASAGGIAALEGFFAAMPADESAGLAFVVVQHLAPDHDSILADLIQRRTSMRVLEIESGMTVQPGCIYIIPPNRDLALLHGDLQLLEPTTPRLRRLPIDFFLKSLAQDQGERAIGVVLSGTGSDGALGVRAIKAAGGMVMVQHPEAAEYDGMPRSAIATGLVDFVLPVGEMPQRLLAYARHALVALDHLAADAPPRGDVALATIFVLLRARTGHDFSHYKQNTIYRRIRRRMHVHQIEALDDYVSLLRNTPAEVEELFRELLIRVTGFFRDAEAFETLKREFAQRVLPSKTDGQAIRVWVPGCCTGEEAYSLTMLMQDLVAEFDRDLEVLVFATDIDAAAIGQARGGVYPAGIAAEIAPPRLARAFDADPDTGRYRVRKAIRDRLIFSEQDVIRDPPFSRLDLISCRNLMIYLDAELQAQLLTVFHYALNPGGLLFLGSSESVGDQRSLFAVLDQKSKVYRRLDDDAGEARASVARSYPSLAAASSLRSFRQRPRVGRPSLRELTERALLRQCEAVGVLVDQRGDILYLHGRTGSYLEPAPGESSLNVLGMAREGLRPALTAAMHEAVAGKHTVRRPGLRVRTNGSFAVVDLTVRRVPTERSTTAESSFFLIVLETPRRPEPDGQSPQAGPAAGPRDADADARIANLEEQLQAQADHLQISRHDLEASNDELRSTNEVIQSLNEELQSTNEEMETSKEELQSVNEELTTVNAELQQRVLELSRANDDLGNLIAGTGVGTIFVDRQLRVQRFTPAAAEVIHLIPSDVGRSIEQVTCKLIGYDSLLTDIRAVLDSLAPLEVEVHTETTWHLLRIRPYRTQRNAIEGAVITFTDVTELKRGQEGLRRLAVVVRDSRDAIVVQDLAGRILAWNPGAERLYGWTEEQALAKNIRDLVPEAQREDAAARLQQLGASGTIRPCRAQRIASDGRIVEIELTASELADKTGLPYAVSTTERENHE